MTQEIKDIYETWFLKATGFLPEQAIDALEEKDKHYAVAIEQLSKHIEELKAQLERVQPYLRHKHTCAYQLMGEKYNCTCGLVEPLKGDGDE